MTKLLAIIILLFCSEQLQKVDSQIINPVVIKRGTTGSCAPSEERQNAIEMLMNDIKKKLPATLTECGDGLWFPVASIDMTDSQQQCPTGWREYNQSSVRACGRPVTSSSSCASVSYTIGRQYIKVCGRVIGYQVASPDGFLSSGTIDQNYVDGVSVTYGRNPRRHIWTYAAGVTENSMDHTVNNCPCWNSAAKQPPEFVDREYYCESANPSDMFDVNGLLYSSDTLWDGQQCSNEGTCCSNAPLPWFNVTLSQPTSDDIEVRICGDESTDNEDTPIELLDIFVQ